MCRFIPEAKQELDRETPPRLSLGKPKVPSPEKSKHRISDPRGCCQKPRLCLLAFPWHPTLLVLLPLMAILQLEINHATVTFQQLFLPKKHTTDQRGAIHPGREKLRTVSLHNGGHRVHPRKRLFSSLPRIKPNRITATLTPPPPGTVASASFPRRTRLARGVRTTSTQNHKQA